MDARLLREELEPVMHAAGAAPCASEMARYLALLSEANERVNLFSRRASERDLAGHVADSLAALPLLPPARFRLLDIGSGGGFPAIPLLLARRDAEAVLVESIGKKADALGELLRALQLTARVARARFPDLPRDMPPFDIMTSRAVADPLGLAAASFRFLRKGGRALLWTTRGVLAESTRRMPYRFHPIAGSDQKGIAEAECFT